MSRTRLVQRLAAATDTTVALLAAPAGYGKTTLLRSWAEVDPRPFVWMSLDGGHDDANVLLEDILAALDDIDSVAPRLRDLSDAAGRKQPEATLRRLARSIVAHPRPFVLVLDDADAVHSDEAVAILRFVADHLPEGCLLALSSRHEPPVPVARLRADRRVLELGAADLAMTSREAAALLTSVGLELRAPEVARLVELTEGWPVALYLAGLAVRDEPDVPTAIAHFGGDDRFVADYLREEVLAPLSPDRLAFLTRTALLDPLSGPLCDAVLGDRGSGGELRDLGRSSLPVSALDRNEEHFRYHPLLAQMLRAELHRVQPQDEAALHCRASAWLDDHGDAVRAIDHAIAGEDLDRAAELLWRVVPAYAWDGRNGIVRQWLARFTEQQIARHPKLALVAATSSLAAGAGDLVERWSRAAARHLGEAPADDRPSLEGGVAIMRAATGWDGVVAMRRNAGSAAVLGTGDSAWHPLCCLLEGAALQLAGGVEDGRATLEEGARRAAVAAPGVEALCLAELALTALLDDDWEQGARLADRARSRVRGIAFDDCPTLALVHAVSAFAHAHRGLQDVQGDIAGTLRSLDAMDGFGPWYQAQARLALARAQLRFSNVAAARKLLADAAHFAGRIPDALGLRVAIDDAWARADTFAMACFSDPSSLTAAELRVLRFLPSHFSFREIAERLHVSANTVKTQAHAVYRKLDASSRSMAVTRARQVGLLDG